jgi:GNAT superfamily N-acetyltransferase
VKATDRELLVRPYEEEDEHRVIELLETALGSGPGGARPVEFFRWKHFANPFGASFMLIGEADGRIVGFRAFLRWRFQAGESTFHAVRAVDTATHPDHQRSGIFSRLTRDALAGLRDDTDLVFNTPNEKSLPGYLKMGWEVVATVRPSLRVRRPLRFVRGLRSLRDLDGAAGEPPPVEAEPAVEALRDEDAVSALLEAAGSELRGLHTPRDVPYLRWRYGTAPLLDYRAVRVERAGFLSGLALFRIRPRGILWEAAIAELVVRPGDARTAGQLLRDVARSARADHLTCWSPSGSTAARAARKHGFLPAPSGVTFVAKPLKGEMRPDPTRRESWALSLGDLEVF